MSFAEWREVYVEKTKTLNKWRVAKDAEYTAQKSASSLRQSVSGGNPLSSTATLTKRQIEIKTAEDKAFLTKTDSNFGFKMMKANAEWAKEIGLVNINLELLERRLNCQRCVVAHEARMRGYDVMARINREWLSAFEYSASEIKKSLWQNYGRNDTIR